MMTIMNLNFGTVIIALSLVYVLPKSVEIWDGHLMSEDQLGCYFLLTDKQASVPLSSANVYLHTACLLEINVEYAISISVYIRSRGSKTSSHLGDVALYDQHPGHLSSQPLATWSNKNVPLVEKFHGSHLWLVVSSPEAASENVDLVLDYSADLINGANGCVQVSDNRFGEIRFQSSNLGSKAQLVCDQGYILINGSGKFKCMVSNGQLAWSGDSAMCESVCKHPWIVQHGTYYLKFIGNQVISGIEPSRSAEISGKEPSRSAEMRSMVRYVCDKPYQLIGNPVSYCTNNIDGVPAWSSPPPTCQSHDCSRTQILTTEAGQIVSPKSSSGVLRGGSLNCTWEISSRVHNIIVNVLRSDLPLEDGVALELYDPESHQRLKLTGRASGEQKSFRSASYSVAVRYNGPRHDISKHTGFVLEYAMLPRGSRRRRAGDNSDTTSADSTTTTPTQSSLSPDTSSYQAVSDSSDITTEQPTASIPTLQGAVPFSVISLMPSSSVDTTPSNPFIASITDVANEQTTQTVAFPAINPSYPPYSTASDTPYILTTMAGTNDIDTVSGVVVSQQTAGLVVSEKTAGVDNPSMSWSASLTADTTSALLPYDTMAASLPDDVSSSSIAPGVNDLTTPVMYDVTTLANLAEESDDGWKIALGIIMPLLGIGLILLVGYIVYRKKYPVRMIIGREFAKFSNPYYNRSKHAPSLVRDDAEDYFSSRASSSVNLDEMNPVNQNIHYNAAFVSEEDEQDKRFIEQKAWLFAKTSNGDSMSSRPMSEITLCSNDSGGAAARIDSTDSLEIEINELLGQQKRTPRIKPKRKKLQSRSSSSSVETLSETASASDSVDVPEGPLRSPDTLSEDQEIPAESSQEDLAVSRSIDSDMNKESTYMKLSKIILEQPTFEEVCAEARLRSRSLSIDRNLPEKRLRSYSVDPFKSARKSSFRNEDFVEPESVKIIYESIRAGALSAEMMGQSTTSITSIISESSIIDESMLDGLADVARERCLSMTSQNSNRHLVTDLDDVSVGGSSHRGDVNPEDASKLVRHDHENSEFSAGMESASAPPEKVENGEIILDKGTLQKEGVTTQCIYKGEVITREVEDQCIHVAQDHLPEGDIHLEQDSDFLEQSTSLSLEACDQVVRVDEDPGKTRVVRFDSVYSSDDGQEQGLRSSSRTLSTTSRGSSLSVSSGLSVSTVTSSESDDAASYSFNNDISEGSKLSGSVDEASEEDGRFSPSPSHSPTPTPLTDAQTSIPLLPVPTSGEPSSSLHFRSPSTEKSSEIPGNNSFVTGVDLSESSSDTSDVEKRDGIAYPKTGLAQIRRLPRQDSVLSSGDDENGTTTMTVDDIALVLDGVSETDDHANGSISLDRPSAGNFDSTKPNTLTLKDIIVEDDIEV